MRSTLQHDYLQMAATHFEQRKAPGEELLSSVDLEHLPAVVQRYLRFSGAVGKPKVWNMRVEFAAQMHKKPGARAMSATSEQYNFFDDYARLFHLKAKMFGLPVSVLHHYAKQRATMVVRVMGLFNIVDLAGPELDAAETVTILNDMAVLAPASLIDPRLVWRQLGDSSAEVTFNNGHTVKAILSFGQGGELVNFISDDRYALGDDGVLRKFRFSTPLGAYRNYNGVKLASEGDAIWHYPEGDFVYGKFALQTVEYNLPCFNGSRLSTSVLTDEGTAVLTATAES
jgi:hypothetical protein